MIIEAKDELESCRGHLGCVGHGALPIVPGQNTLTALVMTFRQTGIVNANPQVGQASFLLMRRKSIYWAVLL